MAQAADQGDLVFPAQGIEIQLHSKAPIPPQWDGIGTLHGTAGFQDCEACRFLLERQINRLVQCRRSLLSCKKDIRQSGCPE